MSNRDKKTNLSLEGKLPPASVDLERAALGALLMDMSLIYKVKAIIPHAHMLYDIRNELIYSVILELDAKNLPFEPLVVCDRLRTIGSLEEVDGSYYVMGLIRDVASHARIEEYCRIIAEKYLLRQMVKIGMESATDCYSGTKDVFEIYSDFEDAMKRSMYNLVAGSSRPYRSRIVKFVENINDPNFRATYYVDTGLPSLNQKLGGGFIRGAVTLLAARTSMGKTSVVISMANNQSKKFPVGLWNGELSDSRFIMRQISNVEKITISEMNREDLHQDVLNRINIGAQILLNDHDIYMDETAPIGIEELCSMVRYWRAYHKIEVVYLDYLRYITLPSGYKYDKMSTQDKITEIMARLNALAKELNIAVVLIQQLNRETEKSADKKPSLANLRDAGSLEEMAATVIFLYRPEHYGILEDEDGSTIDIGLMLIRKNGDHKNPIDVRFRTDAKYFTWAEIEDYSAPPLIAGVSDNDIKQKIDDLPF
jgi:replicative DNA helicase